MKSFLHILFYFLIFNFLSCNNSSSNSIVFHKSHEQSRQNVPFSDAVQVDNLYFLTGQIGKNHTTGQLVTGGIEAETAQALKNIQEVLKQHNLTLHNVIKCTVILSNIDDFSKMNKIYRTFFKDNLPARTTFAANLVGNANIEIEVVAAKN